MLTLMPENRARTLTLIRSKLDHDLRSNLNVILGYCSMLTEDLASGEDPAQLSDDLQYIASAGQELLHLNNQVGDLLEVQQGKWRVAPSEMTVDYVAQDAINEVSEGFPSYTFVLEGSARLDRGDARTTGRILCSLLTQLCKATSVPTTIELDVKPNGHSAIIDVRCLIDESQEPEIRKLQRTFAEWCDAIPILNRIQDFDGYYRTIMCELASARIDPDPEGLSCRVTLSGRADNIGEQNGETLVG